MKIILVLFCCIVFRLVFVDSQGNAVLQDTTQKVFIYDEHQVAQPLTLHPLDTNIMVIIPLIEKEMNQEFSFEIPSLDYQGSFVMRRSNSERAILYFSEQEIHSLSNKGIPLYILELPL